MSFDRKEWEVSLIRKHLQETAETQSQGSYRHLLPLSFWHWAVHTPSLLPRPHFSSKFTDTFKITTQGHFQDISVSLKLAPSPLNSTYDWLQFNIYTCDYLINVFFSLTESCVNARTGTFYCLYPQHLVHD